VSTSFPGLREGHGKQVERYSGIISNPDLQGTAPSMQPKKIWEPKIKSGKCSFLLVVQQVEREITPPFLPKSELKNLFHVFTHFSFTKLWYLNKQYDPYCSNQISMHPFPPMQHQILLCPRLSRFPSLPSPSLIIERALGSRYNTQSQVALVIALTARGAGKRSHGVPCWKHQGLFL